MKKTQSERTGITNMSHSEGTGIALMSESEGTDIKYSNKLRIMFLALVAACLFTGNAIGDELNLFSNKSGEIKGVLKVNSENYFIQGVIQDNILTAEYVYQVNKSASDGTGKKSASDGTGKKTLSVILQCGISEGIIESENKKFEIFSGYVYLNGISLKCN
ncbi:MAG: hypothetical protein L3J52_00060 [Proteobacteria bacterium]|nr:hypothetical protein [Pseudomonadota bacterium]